MSISAATVAASAAAADHEQARRAGRARPVPSSATGQPACRASASTARTPLRAAPTVSAASRASAAAMTSARHICRSSSMAGEIASPAARAAAPVQPFGRSAPVNDVGGCLQSARCGVPLGAEFGQRLGTPGHRLGEAGPRHRGPRRSAPAPSAAISSSDRAAGRGHPRLDGRAQSAHVSGSAPGCVQVGESRAGQAGHRGYRHRRQVAGGACEAVGEPAQRGGVEAHGFGHG